MPDWQGRTIVNVLTGHTADLDTESFKLFLKEKASGEAPYWEEAGYTSALHLAARVRALIEAYGIDPEVILPPVRG